MWLGLWDCLTICQGVTYCVPILETQGQLVFSCLVNLWHLIFCWLYFLLPQQTAPGSPRMDSSISSTLHTSCWRKTFSATVQSGSSDSLQWNKLPIGHLWFTLCSCQTETPLIWKWVWFARKWTQGVYPFSETNFQDWLWLIFQGL